MKIIPTHYTLSSAVGSTIHLRSWIIEASDDGENWIKIDEQNNCDFLDGCNLTHTFKINNHDSNQYSYIKIRQISENSDSHDRLVIGSIEFYGYLITNLNINI